MSNTSSKYTLPSTHNLIYLFWIPGVFWRDDMRLSFIHCKRFFVATFSHINLIFNFIYLFQSLVQPTSGWYPKLPGEADIYKDKLNSRSHFSRFDPEFLSYLVLFSSLGDFHSLHINVIDIRQLIFIHDTK